MADSFAGWSLAILLAPEIAAPVRDRLPLVAACSVLAYWLGMASNDLLDLPKDRVGAPGKPLASGRISRLEAAGLCFLLGLGAVACGIALGVAPLVLALLAIVLAYNGGGKRLPIVGNLLMGSARGANLLLGGAALIGTREALASAPLTGAAGLLGLYIAGVTAVSVLEDREFKRERFLACSSPLLAIPAAFVALAPSSPIAWLNSSLLVLLLAEAMVSASRATTDRPHPAALFVRKALAGIFLVDAGCVAALAPEGAAPVMELAILYLLMLMTRIWTRRWVRAGSMGS